MHDPAVYNEGPGQKGYMLGVRLRTICLGRDNQRGVFFGAEIAPYLVSQSCRVLFLTYLHDHMGSHVDRSGCLRGGMCEDTCTVQILGFSRVAA